MYCAFCGKNDDEVEQMVEGPGANICNECVEIVVDVINAKRPKGEPHKTLAEFKREHGR